MSICPSLRHPLVFAALVFAALLSGTARFAFAAPSVPLRIVSLSPGITEMLYALKLGNRVAGDTDYCDYPPAAKAKPHIGGVSVDYEALIALRPDLVIADKLANEQSIARLRALHVPLLVISVQSLRGVELAILEIGKRTGTAAVAAHVVQTMKRQEKLAQAAVINAHVGGKRILVLAGVDPPYAAGSGTFVGAMVRRLGEINVAGPGQFSPISKETAVADGPQVIVCGADDAVDIERDPAWAASAAVKSGHLIVMDPDILFRPGPRLTAGMLALAAQLARLR